MFTISYMHILACSSKRHKFTFDAQHVQDKYSHNKANILVMHSVQHYHIMHTVFAKVKHSHQQSIKFQTLVKYFRLHEYISYTIVTNMRKSADSISLIWGERLIFMMICSTKWSRIGRHHANSCVKTVKTARTARFFALFNLCT